MWKKIIGGLILIGIFVSLGFFDVNKWIKSTFIKNLMSVSEIIFSLLPLILLVALGYGFIYKKWAVRIEKLNIGGFNVLLDNPDELYKRSVCSFLDTKRTLFKIDHERDNFNDVLNSYFNTYEFLRNEMKILKNGKNKESEMYLITNKALKVLNKFLTNHQSDFRRWYKYVSENNEVESIDGGDKKIKFHMSSIGDIQKNYYRYKEFCEDIKEVTTFFNVEMSKVFKVDKEKWKSIPSDLVLENNQQENF